MSANVGRNDPCPCGSGLKYKQCHAGKMRLNLKGRRGWVLGALGLVAVAAVAWGLARPQARPTAPGAARMPPPAASAGAATAPGASAVPSPATINPAMPGTGAPATMSGPGGVAPQAWAYDATTNRHFDPNHGHWHDGPPPSPDARGVPRAPQPLLGGVPVPGVASPSPSGPTPAPWTFDAQKNQHWNPEHGHWHAGPPPAGPR